MEDVSEAVKGHAIVMRLDMRTTYKLNRQFGVRSSPTLLLFKGGQELPHTREDLAVLRDVRGVSSYVMMHVGDDVQLVKSTDEIDQLVHRAGVAVVGLFDDPTDEAATAFNATASEWRRHVPFAAAQAASVQDLSAAFGVAKLPALFIVKELNVSLQYAGSMLEQDALSEFVKAYGLPLVGHLNSFTYHRYKELDAATKVFLFYDPESPSSRREESMLQSFAAEHRDVVFVAASVLATESGEQDRLHLKMGVSDFRLPGLAIVAPNGAGAVVYNQLQQPLTAENLAPFFQRFLNAATSSQCVVDGWRSDVNRTRAELDSYSEYADAMKERIYIKRSAPDVSEQVYRKTEARTKKDILTIYTARWCVYSLRLEQLIQDIIDRGELDDLLEQDLEIKTVDVVLNPPLESNRVDMVPTMRYLPARYKNVPFFFRGDYQDAESVLEWVRAYHSMRYVDIPGEAPSPFGPGLQREQSRGAEWLSDITKQSEMSIDLDGVGLADEM